MKAAHRAGTVVSYDLNYRKKLWDASEGGSARALQVNRSIVSCADVLIGNEEDLQLGLGIAGPEVSSAQPKLDTRSFHGMIERTRAQYPGLRVIATTLREVRSASRHLWKAVLWCDGKFHETEEMELDVYDRIGGATGSHRG